MAEIGARVAWKLAKALKGKSKPVTAKTGTATVTHVGSDGRLWVRLPGSSVDTPVNGVSTTEVSAGDSVSYSIDRGRLSVMGNSTSPSVSRSGATSIARSAVLPVDRKADDAIADAERARKAADEADSSAQRAMTSANAAGVAAAAAGESASAAHEAADSALVNLSVVEDVVGTLEWISEHGSFVATTDIEVVEGRVYFELSGGDYVPVAQPEGNPSENGWYVLDVSESQTEYVMAHLAVTSAGLWVLPSGLGTAQSEDMAPGYKALLTATGMHIYDASGNSVAFYGPTTRIGKASANHLELTDTSVSFADASGTVRPWQVKTDESYHRNPFSDSASDLLTGVVNTIGALKITPWWMQIAYGSDLHPRPAFTLWRDVGNAVHMLFGKPYDPDASDNAVRMELDADSLSVSNDSGNAVFEIRADGMSSSNADGMEVMRVKSDSDTGSVFVATEVGESVEWSSDQDSTSATPVEFGGMYDPLQDGRVIVWASCSFESGGDAGEITHWDFEFQGGTRETVSDVMIDGQRSGICLEYDGETAVLVVSEPYSPTSLDWCEFTVDRVTYESVPDVPLPAFTLGTRFGVTQAFSGTIGEGIETVGDHQVAVGYYNRPDADDLFQVGNGTIGDGRNAFSVDRYGNGRVYGRMYSNSGTLLWSGSYLMSADHTATLSEAIADQSNGIVLVWSAYSDGQARDYDFHYDFVPKKAVYQHNGSGLTCIMAGAGFSHVAAKYVNVTDPKSMGVGGSATVTGHAANTQSGTASGISYDNASFVLREIWGV